MAEFYQNKPSNDASEKDDQQWLPVSINDETDDLKVDDKYHHPTRNNYQQEEHTGHQVVSYQQKLDALSQPINFKQRVLITIENTLFAIQNRFRGYALEEYESGNGFNFVPVILAMGIITYFVAGSEPVFWVLVLSSILPAAISLKLQSRRILFHFAIATAIFFAGMSVAKWQIMRTTIPLPIGDITSDFTGTILNVDQNARGSPRYLIKPNSIKELKGYPLPARIRISSASKHNPLKAGDTISGLAKLRPVSGPAFPGGYDFSFFSQINGLGLSGFTLGSPKKIEGLEHEASLTLKERFLISINQWRQAIGQRIKKILPAESGAVSIALITGDRSGLSKNTQESLRRSGLAHILAISGLHMALVTLTVIWIVRLGFVLVPSLAVKYPIKKWAVLAGFSSATIYLFLSGVGIATLRAWIMITVMLAANLFDRRAITMRSVAIAGLIILVFSPTNLFQPGFQMSFAAVIALVAVYRQWTKSISKNKETKLFQHQSFGKQLLRYFGGLAATSLIAGSATALFALWHFHRVAPLGLISNLLAMPLVSILVMPLSLISTLLMPYGLESLALEPLGLTINWVIEVSDFINSYNIDFETGAKSSSMLLASSLTLIVACFITSRLRIFALLPMIICVSFSFKSVQKPDILISEDGRGIGLNSRAIPSASHDNAHLVLPYPRRNQFVTQIWQRAYFPNTQNAKLSSESKCDKDECHFVIKGKKVSVIFDPDLLQSACYQSDILLAPRLWWVNCRQRTPELVLKRGDFELNGSHALYIKDKLENDILVKSSRSDSQQTRLWQQRYEVTKIIKSHKLIQK